MVPSVRDSFSFRARPRLVDRQDLEIPATCAGAPACARGPPRAYLIQNQMAKPIEPTPVLYDEDARRALESLKNVAPADELARRREAAQAFAKRIATPVPKRGP